MNSTELVTLILSFLSSKKIGQVFVNMFEEKLKLDQFEEVLLPNKLLKAIETASKLNLKYFVIC